MGKPKAPPAPDYAALAQQQGAESRDTAGFNTNINRVNQVGPDGSVTWSQAPGADPMHPGVGDYTQTTTLSPVQQRLYDSQNAISQNFADTAQAGLARVGNSMGQTFNPQGLPELRTVDASGASPNGQVNPGRIPYRYLSPGSVNMAYNGGRLPNASVSAGNVQGSLSTNGLPALDYGTAESRKRVEDAMRARINPQLDEQQHNLESQLLNSGLEKGSQAWNSELDRMGRARNDAEQQITAAGGAEESRLAALQQAQRAQLFGETTTQGQFANAANAQRYSQNLGAAQFGNQAAGQQFNQGLQEAQFGNQASAQNFLQQLQAGQFGNQAAGQDFSQRLQSGQFGNQAAYQQIMAAMQAANQNNQTRGQGFQEQLLQRQLPLNETNALRTGAQVQTPQFGSYYTGGNAQAAPVMDAGLAQGAYDMNRYNQQQSGYNALLGGLAGLGSAWIGG